MFHTKLALAEAGLNPDLIYEYGLQLPHFNLLEFIFKEGQVSWPDGRLQEISGAPANALRKLVDLGLLEGPARGESIRVRPFRLTDQGRKILAKIRYGLHKPAWITSSRAWVIRLLVEGNTDALGLKSNRVRRLTLISLEKNGYINDVIPGHWTLTALGREAWAEYQAWQKS